VVSCILNLGVTWELASLPERLNSGQNPSIHMWVPHPVWVFWSREKCFALAGVECRFAYCSAHSFATTDRAMAKYFHGVESVPINSSSAGQETPHLLRNPKVY
jgi:hypothetical protein